MRHQSKSKTLGRSTSQMKALLRSLLNHLIIHEKIETTKPRAKLLKGLFDRLVCRTKSKEWQEAVRYIKKYVYTREAWTKLMNDIAKRYEDRNSWFTRIFKIWNRAWDNAEMVLIQLI